MIHRFTEIEDAAEYGRIPYMSETVGTGADNIFVTGNGFAKRQLNPSPEGGQLGTPELSPDKTEAVWSGTSGTSSRLRLCSIAPSSSPSTLISWTPFSTNVDAAPCWHPDGTQIVYVKAPASFGGNYQIRRIDRDGTNDTLLKDVGAVTNLWAATYSPSGDYIMYITRESAQGHLWVMNADGTGATEHHTSTYELAFGERCTPAWKHDTDVLGFSDMTDVPGTSEWYTMNADGTSKTVFYNDTTREYWGHGRHSWLSDNSAMTCLRRTNGTGPFDATAANVAKITTGGSASDISPTQSTGGWLYKYSPSVQTTGDEPYRIYFGKVFTIAGVRSVLEDGSDARDEHNDTGEVFRGFEWRGVN